MATFTGVVWAATEKGVNLIKNGGFEDEGKYWNVANAPGPEGKRWKVEFESGHSFRGGNALEVVNNIFESENFVWVGQEIEVKAGSSYRVEAYLSAENVHKTHFKMNFYNAEGKQISDVPALVKMLHGVQSWELYGKTLVAPAGAVKAKVWCLGGTSFDGENPGISRFDEVSVAEIVPGAKIAEESPVVKRRQKFSRGSVPVAAEPGKGKKIDGSQQGTIRVIGPDLQLSNGYFDYRLQLKNGLYLKEIVNKYIGDNCLKMAQKGELFALMVDDVRISSSEFSFQGIENTHKGKSAKAKIFLESVKRGIDAELEILVDNSPNIVWLLRITNNSSAAFRLITAFPLLNGIKIGEDLTDNWYTPVYRSSTITNRSTWTRIGTGGKGAKIQVMDIYNPVLGGGIYLRPNNHPEMGKIFTIWKIVSGEGSFMRIWDQTPKVRRLLNAVPIDDSLGMGLVYYEQDLRRGETFETPETVTGVHPDDFRNCLKEYRQWVDTWFKKEYETPEWFRRVMISGSANPRRGDLGYNLERLVGHSERFGGYDQLVLSQWWRRATVDSFGKNDKGRPWNIFNHGGFFLFDEEYGGEEKLARGCRLLRDDPGGFPLLFYLDGFIAGKYNTEVGKKYGEKWAMKDYQGAYYGYYCDDREQNWNMCIGYVPWRDYLVDAVVNAVKKFDIDGIRLDSLGSNQAFACYNPAHQHPTTDVHVTGTAELVKKIREEVKKIKPEPFIIIFEETMNDYALQFQEGFIIDYNFVEGSYPFYPLISLFRFCFPEELSVVYPYLPAGYNYRAGLFNGLGIMIDFNMPILSTGGPADRRYIEKICPVLKENADAFRGKYAYPLIKTEAEGVYANSFPNNEGNKRIITLYNTNSFSSKGILINVPHRERFHYVDLLNHEEITYEKKGEQTGLSLELKPDDAVALGELPLLLRAKRKGGNLEVRVPHSFKDGRLRLLLFDKHNKLLKMKSFPLADSHFTLNLKDVFGTEKGKLAVQLLERKFLRDETVVNGLL